MGNQSNCFIPRLFYIVKGKNAIKKLKLSSAVDTVWKVALKAACHAA